MLLSLEAIAGTSGRHLRLHIFSEVWVDSWPKETIIPRKNRMNSWCYFLVSIVRGPGLLFHENFETHLEAERPKELQKKNWRSLFKKDKCQCCLGGGNSNISYFHPYLGKWSNLTVSYFSKGWFNHQLVVVGVSFKKPSFLEQFRNGRFDIAMAGKSRLSRDSSGRNSGCLQ